MYRLQLQDAQSQVSLLKAANVAPSSPEFIEYLNRAQERLKRRGDWYETEWVIEFCVSGNMIAWPRFVDTCHGLKWKSGFRSHGPAHVFNNNFSFVGPHLKHDGWRGDSIIEDANPSATTNEISGLNGKLLQYYTVLNNDIGSTITIFGTRLGGQPVMEINPATGQYQQGLTITAAAPYGTSTTLFTHIHAITRSATQGPAYLFEYDPTTGVTRDLAAFEPGDTHPRFRRSKIISRPWGVTKPDANGICWSKFEALVKVKLLPLANPRDFLMIDNVDALKFMIQAIKSEEALDQKTSEASIMQAIRELNFELREKHPDDQIPIRVNPMMGRAITNPSG